MEAVQQQRLFFREMHPAAELHVGWGAVLVDAMVPNPSELSPTTLLKVLSNSNALRVSSPCENFSTEGSREGNPVGSGRLSLQSAKGMLNSPHMPGVLFYEQVANVLSQKNKGIWETSFGMLKAKYKHVDDQAMVACDHGCPQKWRKRAILVATKHEGWVWPVESLWLGKLGDILDPCDDDKGHRKALPPKENKRDHQRVSKFVNKELKDAMASCSKEHRKAHKAHKPHLKNIKNMVVDTGCSERHARKTVGIIRILTRTLCSAFDYRIIRYGQRISLPEISRGFAVLGDVAAKCKAVAANKALPESALIGMLGNAAACSLCKVPIEQAMK